MFAFPHVVHFSWRSVPFSFPFGYSPPPRTSLPHRPSLPPLTSLPGSSLAVPVFASIPALTIFTDFFWPSHLLDYTVNSLRVGAGPTYLRVHGDSLSGAGKVLMSLFFFFFFFCLFSFFRAAPSAYGGFQARGLIGAVAAGLHHSHSSMASEQRLQPTTQLMATLDL